MMPRFVPVTRRDYDIEDCRNAAALIKGKTIHKPKVAVVLGSGMDDFGSLIEEAERITYVELNAAIQSFPTCSMPPGRDGCFVFGVIDGVTVVVMFGRFHVYEGHSAQATTFPIRIMNEVSIPSESHWHTLAGCAFVCWCLTKVFAVSPSINTAWD